MMSVHDLVVEVEEKVEGIILSFTEVRPEELGLDTRCAYKLYINEDYIACRDSDKRNLNYYGGFEYVDSRCVFSLGNFHFYSIEDSRVSGHLDTFFSTESEEEQ